MFIGNFSLEEVFFSQFLCKISNRFPFKPVLSGTGLSGVIYASLSISSKVGKSAEICKRESFAITHIGNARKGETTFDIRIRHCI